jgi:hypothetical protein
MQGASCWAGLAGRAIVVAQILKSVKAADECFARACQGPIRLAFRVYCVRIDSI